MSIPKQPNRRRIAGEAAPGVTPAKKPLKKRPGRPVSPAKKAQKEQQPSTHGPSAQHGATPPPAPPPSAPPTKPVASRPSRTSRRPAAPKRTSPSAKLLAPVIAAAVLATGFAIGPGLLGWPIGEGLLEYKQQRALVDREPDPAESAATAAETIFSFSSGNLDEHREESKALMTSGFQKEFEQLIPAMSELVPQRQIAVKAEAREAAVAPCGSECAADRARVLVFVDLGRFMGEDDSRKVFANRIVMQMVKVDGEWLVDGIDAL